jgi:hypothetical protein
VPNVRVQLGIYTDQAYDANKIPDMSNSQPTGLYYNPTFASGLGSIFLWPVPNTSTNDLELFLQKGLAQFADTTSTVYLPDSALNSPDAPVPVLIYGHPMGSTADQVANGSGQASRLNKRRDREAGRGNCQDRTEQRQDGPKLGHRPHSSFSYVRLP